MSNSAPIYGALAAYCGENILRLHMPGHTGARGFKTTAFKALAGLDVTEVPGLDDLHMPQGIIEEAQSLLARAYGANKSRFLVNGATSGIHALLMGMDRDGAQVLIPRNAHRSFFGGLILSGAHPVYMPCQVDKHLGIAAALDTETVSRVLVENPEAEAVFAVSPTYYGTTSFIDKMAAMTREGGKKLFVDEAHGGHFPFHDDFPASALSSGADAVVNGLHKTLPVFNQGACLHFGQSCPGMDRVDAAWDMLTTTSPSYLIMASIDLARQFMEEEGYDKLQQAMELSRYYSQKIDGIKGLHVYHYQLLECSAVADKDPLKILIDVRNLNLHGQQLAEILRYKYHIQVEFADTNYILAMMSIFHDRQDWETLYTALSETAAIYGGSSQSGLEVVMPPEPQVCLSPREAFYAGKRSVSFEQARGEISAEMIAAYPPGIPCLLPGERITEEVYNYLQYLRTTRVAIHGQREPGMEKLDIIEE